MQKTVITVEVLQHAKILIDRGLSCETIAVEGELCVTKDAIEWLKSQKYRIKVLTDFGPTGVSVIIYNAPREGLKI